MAHFWLGMANVYMFLVVGAEKALLIDTGYSITNAIGYVRQVTDKPVVVVNTHMALRYFNACGAHPSGKIGEAHNPETHLIPVILQVPNGKRAKLSIFGGDYPTKDGTCVRDYIHVTDLAQAHILALDYLLKGGKNDVFNLGNGVGFTNKEVVDMARAVTGHPIPAEIAPRRAGDPAQLVASSEKAKSVLGWKPQYADLTTIVSSAWAWHKSYPNGYDE